MAENDAIEADLRAGSTAQGSDGGSAMAGLDDPGWIRLSHSQLRLGVAKDYPGLERDDLRLAAEAVLAYVGAAWHCYVAGAVAAYWDVSAIIDRYGLAPFLAYRRSSFYLSRRSFGAPDDAGPYVQRKGLAAHQTALTHRLRYECARSAAAPSVGLDHPSLSLQSYDAIPDGVDPRGMTEREFHVAHWAIVRPLPDLPHGAATVFGTPRADGSTAGIGAAIATAEGLLHKASRVCTHDAIRKSCTECRKLRAAADAQQVAGVPVKGRCWPGRYYIPSERTCIELGWRRLSADLSAVGAASDDPIRWFQHLFRI